jgi:phosphoribosylamine--glycine ligase
LRVLVVGGGGREHAIVWKLRQSPRVSEVFCIPGNAGMMSLAKCVAVDDQSVECIAHFAETNQIDLTIVGPEAFLVNGIVDAFEAKGLRIFGPTASAARLEGSKLFAKSLMMKYGIPTARYRAFDDVRDAIEFAEGITPPMVVKADGIAAGKGVTIAHSTEEAIEALKQAMVKKEFGASGDKVVIEEFLEGEEATILAFTDGTTVIPMVTSQDHKAVFDGDTGPNTGGMGACSPAPIVSRDVSHRVYNQILCPIVEALKAEGIKYKGVLYAGLMLKDGEPKVVEFNCRFGDPETQVVLPRLRTDLVDIVEAVIDERLHETPVHWTDDCAVCVVMASGGYPRQYIKGMRIEGLGSLSDLDKLLVFHSATAMHDSMLVTNGGRVLAVTGLGADIEEARNQAYSGVKQIEFKGAHYRTDIASKALMHQGADTV